MFFKKKIWQFDTKISKKNFINNIFFLAYKSKNKIGQIVLLLKKLSKHVNKFGKYIRHLDIFFGKGTRTQCVK